MLEKNAVLPNIHFETPNRRIPFDQWKIQVPTTLMSWPNPQLRRSSVNSFGYGGTNAHVIIDDADSYLQGRKPKLSNGTNGHANGVSSTKNRLILLSARDDSALERLRHSYSEYLSDVADKVGAGQLFDEASFMDNLAYTLGCKRSVFLCRSFITASSLPDLHASFTTQKLSSTKAASVPHVAHPQGRSI